MDTNHTEPQVQDYCFIAVNYGTSSLVRSWANNIRKHISAAKIILVDNFSTEHERGVICEICYSENIDLLMMENVGYGQALNYAINYCMEKYTNDNIVFFAGNLDIAFTKIELGLPFGQFVYIPRAIQDGKSLNPFLTEAQKKTVMFHRLTVIFNSPFLRLVFVIMTKLVGILTYSRLWAVHGSLFCFHKKCLTEESIFNVNSFLYCEELEFASYMRRHGAVFTESKVTYQHTAHVATNAIISNRTKEFAIWRNSFNNWLSRWN